MPTFVQDAPRTRGRNRLPFSRGWIAGGYQSRSALTCVAVCLWQLQVTLIQNYEVHVQIIDTSGAATCSEFSDTRVH